MRRSGVGSRSHGSHIGRFEEENSGRTGAAAAGCDVEEDRNRRIRDLLDDVAGGFNGASGSTDLDQYSLIVAALGFVDGAGDVFLGDGLNGVVDDDLEDLSVRGGTENESCHQGEKNSRDSVAFHRSPSLQQYSYSHLWLAADISRASPAAGFPECVPPQPGRLVLPVIRRAPRSYVKYDHAHCRKTSMRFWKPI